jgi:hypothetical protein
MINAGSNVSLTSRPRLTESNLTESKYMEGIDQLRNALECKSLTKGEAGIHVVGSMVLQSFRHDRDNFVTELVDTLNSVCRSSSVKFRASLALGPSAHQVLDSFASEKQVEVISAGWIELVDCEDRQTDKRLLGVFMLPNGRKGVGVFQVSH